MAIDWMQLICKLGVPIQNIDGLVQDCSNSGALALELLQFCNKPSIYTIQRATDWYQYNK